MNWEASIPVVARFKSCVYSISLPGIADSNPVRGMSVCLLWLLCMLSGRGLCVWLITRPDESYRLWCVVVCDLENSIMIKPRSSLGRSATGQKIHVTTLNSFRRVYIAAAFYCSCILLQYVKLHSYCTASLMARCTCLLMSSCRYPMPMSAAMQCNAKICEPSSAGNACSNPTDGTMFVSCVCYFGKDLCDGLNTCLEESYRLCVCVCVCVEFCVIWKHIKKRGCLSWRSALEPQEKIKRVPSGCSPLDVVLKKEPHRVWTWWWYLDKICLILANVESPDLQEMSDGPPTKSRPP